MIGFGKRTFHFRIDTVLHESKRGGVEWKDECRNADRTDCRIGVDAWKRFRSGSSGGRTRHPHGRSFGATDYTLPRRTVRWDARCTNRSMQSVLAARMPDRPPMHDAVSGNGLRGGAGSSASEKASIYLANPSDCPSWTRAAASASPTGRSHQEIGGVMASCRVRQRAFNLAYMKSQIGLLLVRFRPSVRSVPGRINGFFRVFRDLASDIHS